MAVLMINPAVRAKIKEAVEKAEASPIPWETMKRFVEGIPQETHTVELKDRPADFERPPSQQVLIPVGYRAAFSIEEQPAGFVSHLSISREGAGRGKVPNEHALAIICEEFGMKYPGNRVWLEEYEEGRHAVNIVQVRRPRQEGSA